LYEKPKILVLGATGHVGRLLHGVPVPEFTQNAVWHSRGRSGEKWSWDILNEHPSEVNFDGILLLTRGSSAAQEVEIVQRVCDFAQGRPVLFASSQAVYGKQDGPISETFPVRPNSSYGEAKAAAEEIISAYPKGLSLRLGNVAGADMLFKEMATGPVALDQFEDGTGPKRSYIGPSTFAALVVPLFKKLVKGSISSAVLNCANPGNVAMSDCLDQAGADWEWRPARVDALHSLELNTTNLQKFVELNPANAGDLVAETRLAGWRLYNESV